MNINPEDDSWSVVLKKSRTKKGKNFTCIMGLHLYILFASNLPTQLGCSVVLSLVIIFCGAQWEWLLGGVMERVSSCHECYSSTFICWSLICCQERCQPKTSCGLNELLSGRQSALTYLLFTPQLWEGIRYLLCTQNTVELYKSNVVRTQWIYCAFTDWLCVYICVEMQAVGLKRGGR